MIDAWEPQKYKDPPNSLANSQTSLTSSGTRSLFGRSKGRIYPGLSTEEADDATNSITSGRGEMRRHESRSSLALWHSNLYLFFFSFTLVRHT